MAILWQKHHRGVLYQVRTAGKTRRLYADGVCHTQFHPQRVVTASVWDLLLLPALFQPANKIRHVLMLGLGGGALVHLYRHFLNPEKITAVELDKIHIQVARRFFGIKQAGVKVINADAHAWLNEYSGPPFDVIIDDLFSHQDGVPQRAVVADHAWFRGLAKNITSEGLVVMNFADRQEFNSSAFKTTKLINDQFQSVYQFSNRLLDNRVLCFSKINLDKKRFATELECFPELNPKRNMSFNLRKIK